MHALRRDVFYAHEGAIRRRHLQQQNDQAWCLTLAANAITAWMTEYLGLPPSSCVPKAGGSTTRSWRTCPRPSPSPSG